MKMSSALFVQGALKESSSIIIKENNRYYQNFKTFNKENV